MAANRPIHYPVTHADFLARLRMHVSFHTLCGVEYDCADDFHWSGALDSTGYYYWRDGCASTLVFSWSPTTIVCAASMKGGSPLAKVELPPNGHLEIGPPVTQALWLEDGKWFVADEARGIEVLSASLHKDEPFDPFFMEARAAATAWGWFNEQPRVQYETAFKIATLPVGSEVDQASAAFFKGETEKHWLAEQRLASLGLQIKLVDVPSIWHRGASED